MSKLPKNYYVDNAKFLESIKKYKVKVREAEDMDDPKPQIPDFCGLCILKIAKGLTYNRKFIGYSFKEEMESDAVENCILYFDNFDVEKYKNPHAYFTTISWYAFLRRIEQEEENSYIKYKSYHNHVVDNWDLEEHLKEENISLNQDGTYDNLNEFIHKFEKKKERQRNERKAKKKLKMEESGVSNEEPRDVDACDDSGSSDEVEFFEQEFE